MALRESETTTSVTSVASARYTLRSATREVAPRSMASWAKEWPSTTVPTMQKNISPGANLVAAERQPCHLLVPVADDGAIHPLEEL